MIYSIIYRPFSLHFTQKRVNLHWKVRKSVSITHKIELSSVIYEKGGQEMSMINHHKRIKIDMLFGFCNKHATFGTNALIVS